jgi:hypothetical protein
LKVVGLGERVCQMTRRLRQLTVRFDGLAGNGQGPWAGVNDASPLRPQCDHDVRLLAQLTERAAGQLELNPDSVLLQRIHRNLEPELLGQCELI